MEKNAVKMRRDEKISHQTDLLGQIDYNVRQVEQRKLQTQRMDDAEAAARLEYQLKLEDTLNRARSGQDNLNVHPIRKHHHRRFNSGH